MPWSSDCFTTGCFRFMQQHGVRRLPMLSDLFDVPVGIRKVKRAEATLLHHSSDDLSALGKSELAEVAWALSTILLANQQGLRLVPGVFAMAESVAHSRISTSVECSRVCHSPA